ncbi:uncharacterized protein LOC127869940 [Dreissena polymorpha]|uniref:Uncharacterized protein n=1 Tax=Dreissena polymorpha TaxID=45954 RepID=A0A9D4M8M2_DREPO|nr:uncharacterized protein LOC127869940 [Dreissena polymorpha]KAH3870401.1 hypothetical protein DPMN_033587 [Dreissena polymorpha]
MSAFTRFGQSQFDSVSSSMASTPAFPLTSSDGLSAASREQAVFHSIEDDETLVKERVIHKPTADVNRPMDTPDSVISSSSNRFILPSNGRPGTYVNAGGIQQVPD